MFKLVIALLVGVGLHLATPQIPPDAALPSQQGLAHLLFTSPIMALNPQVSVACFTDYIAHLNVAGEAYSRDYKLCLIEAKEERKQIEVDAVEERHQIFVASDAVCSSLRTCNAQNNTMELFHCHAGIGSDNTKLTYGISGNASEYATILQERYRLVDLHYQQCCHRAEREYVSTTADNYSHLQACLEGRVKPRPATTTAQPTTSPTTTSSMPTTSSTTTTTTEAPSDLPQTPTPLPIVGEEQLTTIQPNQGIQTQVKELLNLLN